jgi:uncharacterized membrane protein YqaE (UPF0057 family)
MRKTALQLLGAFICISLFSCTSYRNGDFSKIKYLDKNHVKYNKSNSDEDLRAKKEKQGLKPVEKTIFNEQTAENLLGPDLTANVSGDNYFVENVIVNKEIQNKVINPEDILSFSTLKRNKRINAFKRPYDKYKTQDVPSIIKVILAIFIPPLAVFLHRGLASEFWISLILTLLFVLPGIIYALLVVLDVI